LQPITGYNHCTIIQVEKKHRLTSPLLTTNVKSDTITAPASDPSDINQNHEEQQLFNEKKTSIVWNHAIKISSQLASYNECGKVISTSGGSTSTLSYHLMSKHRILDASVPSISLHRKRGILPPPEKRRLNLLSIKCIIEDSRTFSDLNKPGTQKLFDALLLTAGSCNKLSPTTTVVLIFDFDLSDD
ncbi:unnamed protein product, partial [Didymodactylos carnosus]